MANPFEEIRAAGEIIRGASKVLPEVAEETNRLVRAAVDLLLAANKTALPHVGSPDIVGGIDRAAAASSRHIEELNPNSPFMTDRTEYLERLFSTKPIHDSKTVRDSNAGRIGSGYVEDEDGTPIHVVLRKADDGTRNEVRTYELKKQSPFASGFGVTVERDGLIVQERVGKSLYDRAKTLANRALKPWSSVDPDQMLPRILGRDSLFPRLFEEAAVERSILGDDDGILGNFGATVRNKRLKISNLDMSQAFDTHLIPEKPKLLVLRDRPISEPTLAITDQFVSRFTSAPGQAHLRAIGLSTDQTASMLGRARWHLRSKAFAGQNSLKDSPLAFED